MFITRICVKTLSTTIAEVCKIVHSSNVLIEVCEVCSFLDGCVQNVPETSGKGLSQCDAVISRSQLTSCGGLSPAQKSHKSWITFYAFGLLILICQKLTIMVTHDYMIICTLISSPSFN